MSKMPLGGLLGSFDPDKLKSRFHLRSPYFPSSKIIMEARCVDALQDPESLSIIEKRLYETLMNMGLDKKGAFKFVDILLMHFTSNRVFGESEHRARAAIKEISVQTADGSKSITEVIGPKFKGRAEKIFSQIAPCLKDVDGRILDFGAGNGELVALIKNRFGLDVIGYDIVPLTVPGVKYFDGMNLPEDDNTFSTAILTNVLHHTANAEEILAELHRVTEKKLIVIETVPPSDLEPKQAFDLTMICDYVSNRIFRDLLGADDVPVPGEFKTTEDWYAFFESHGWMVCDFEYLGNDQPNINVPHVLFTLEKIPQAD